MFPLLLISAGVGALILFTSSDKTVLSAGRYRICVPPGTQSDPGFTNAFQTIEDAGDNCFNVTVASEATLRIPAGVTVQRI